MPPEKTEAVVIRQVDFSESSRIVTFFTREHGKLTALAKGAKRLKSAFQVALDLLATCDVVFLRKSSGSLNILTDARLIARFQVPGRQLVPLYGGYYVAELLAGLTEDFDPHPDLYDHTQRTLARLQEDDDPYPALLRFQLLLLREIGLLPNFEEQIVGGTRVPRDDSDQDGSGAHESSFALWVSEGGMIASEHRPERFRHRSEVSLGTLRLLERLAHDDETTARRAVPSTRQRKEIQQLLTAAISASLGRRPKMLRYL